MKEQHENRRVRMTKRLMKDALLELLEKQELANISVTAICETADVHRSTFYKYYTDPSALLKEIEQDFLDQIPNPQNMDLSNQEKLLSETAAFFDFVKNNNNAFRILFNNKAGDSFATRLVDFLCSGYIPVIGKNDDLSSHYIRMYIAHGTVGMLREWVLTDFPVSSLEIAKKMYYLSKKLSS